MQSLQLASTSEPQNKSFFSLSDNNYEYPSWETLHCVVDIRHNRCKTMRTQIMILKKFKWLIHYTTTILGVVHCPSYVWHIMHDVLGAGSTITFTWLVIITLARTVSVCVELRIGTYTAGSGQCPAYLCCNTNSLTKVSNTDKCLVCM